jgi:hypothetical protein
MKLRIQTILQERQELGTSSEYATALVAFFVEDGGRCFAGCCRVKQTVGAKFADSALEVGAPAEYQGPDCDYMKFRALVEKQYREAVRLLPAAQAYVCNVVQYNGLAEEI